MSKLQVGVTLDCLVQCLAKWKHSCMHLHGPFEKDKKFIFLTQVKMDIARLVSRQIRILSFSESNDPAARQRLTDLQRLYEAVKPTETTVWGCVPFAAVETLLQEWGRQETQMIDQQLEERVLKRSRVSAEDDTKNGEWIKKTADLSLECFCCKTAPATEAFQSCGHLGVCKDCAEKSKVHLDCELEDHDDPSLDHYVYKCPQCKRLQSNMVSIKLSSVVL